MSLKEAFYRTLIMDDRWKDLLHGYGLTLLITLLDALLGIVIGIILAAIRSTYDKNKEALKMRGGFGYWIMKILNFIANIYLTVIRGTPVVVQLLISYFIIFAAMKASVRNGIIIAFITFGINSGAYVAEIFRGGIMSIDNGQFEAGRSLGFNYLQTMRYIIIPQMFKVVLPTLINEFIALLKETSVAGYVGIMELTKQGDIIRGNTFIAFPPLITVAAIYLVTVIILTQFDKWLERKLRSSDR